MNGKAMIWLRASVLAGATLFTVNVPAAVVSLLYLAEGELRSVGFDGTQFLGSFTSLETPDPAMSGISVIRAIDPGTTGIPEPTSLALVCLGMAVLGSSLRRSAA